MAEIKRFSMVKPTEDTLFHIDYNWWRENDNNWQIFLQNYLCPEHQTAFEGSSDNTLVDWIDPDSAEVTLIDGILHALKTHCSLQPGFIDEHNAVVDAVFKVLFINGSKPMTARQIGEKINRPADLILRTLAGPKVYRGIRPVQ